MKKIFLLLAMACSLTAGAQTVESLQDSITSQIINPTQPRSLTNVTLGNLMLGTVQVMDSLFTSVGSQSLKGVADTSYDPGVHEAGRLFILKNYAVAMTYTKFGGIVVDTNEYVQVVDDGSTYQKYSLPISLYTGDKYSRVTKGEQIKTYSIISDTGTYIINSADSTAYPTDSVGYIIPTTGLVFTSTSSFKYTRFIDITGFSYVYHSLAAGSAGYAFYDASKVYISGNTGAGSYQYIAVPAGAKYFRTSKNNSINIADAGIYLRNIYKHTNPEQLTLVNNGVNKTYTAKSKAVEFGIDSSVVLTDRALVFKPGTYNAKQYTGDVSTFGSGYVNVTTGLYASSSNYKVSDYIPVAGYNKVVATMANGSVAAMFFYDASKLPISGTGQSGTSPDANVPVKYEIPLNAVYVRISIPNSNTTKIANLINEFIVPENSIAYSVDGVPTVLSLGTTSNVGGAELVEDLPRSNGSDITTNHAYRDSTTGHVIVKP